MLMEAAGLCIIDEIVFHNDTGAALIRIKSPATIRVRIYIVEHIIFHDSPLRRTECINTAHVTQHAPADMVHMIETDVIAFRKAFSISPSPADRKACIEEVCYLVMSNIIVTALPNPYSYCRSIYPSS